MSSCIYDRVFIVPPANDSFGRGPHHYNSEPRKSKISIAWWLVPCMVVWVASAFVLS